MSTIILCPGCGETFAYPFLLDGEEQSIVLRDEGKRFCTTDCLDGYLAGREAGRNAVIPPRPG